MRYVNLGILAHVDAGKTSLTERLLFTTGVISRMGSVDAGNTQTDSLELERQRGITIKAAVVSFVLDDLTVNLIDTPGHPDFIAEVERVLSVLDGAVLVISAVEGVQPQTRVLMRALQRLRIPTLIFINKIDRGGAQPVVRLIELLAERDEALLAEYITDESALSWECLHKKLATQTRQALVHPIFFGSAITGAGVDSLITGITTLLPTDDGNTHSLTRGMVFKIERGAAGEKLAYVRMFGGTLRVREQVPFGRGKTGRITAISLFERGSATRSATVAAGQIGKIAGLAEVQIGDTIGTQQHADERHFFAPPTLETLIVPRRPAERTALHAALTQLAEQDPLINLRRDELRQELFVSLYGEVQKEVLQETLRNEYNLEVTFHETTVICVERPVGSGSALELLGKAANPFLATVGLRVEVGPPNSGVNFRLDDELSAIPIYIYKSGELFAQAMEETVQETLRQGLYGWQVTDCMVTLTHSGYTSPASTARDFRLLTPLVLMAALHEAETVVCEPIHRFQLELPADSLGPLLAALARLRAVPQSPLPRGASYEIEGLIPAAQVHALQQQLPGLSH
ncbi:MAG: GTP-binding protein, partial [Chloroflexaceae bacterium]|nr:GTP-binding protein [Chloroflexaceae bacterium]